MLSTGTNMQAQALESGKKFDNFELGTLIAKGGMGAVYRGSQLSPSRTVALKIIEHSGDFNDGVLAHLQNEAELAAKFNNDHLITVYACGYIDGFYYMAMEYLGGGDLQDRLLNEIDTVDALKITRQIAYGLRSMHARNMVHRDIKPGNILFHENGKAVLADFGIAGELAEQQNTSADLPSMGTPLYMSPEHIVGDAVDGRSDIYSLGVVLFQMLTGRPPYTGESTKDLQFAHLHEPVPLLPESKFKLQAILDRMLAKHPADRFRNIDELLAEIDKHLQHKDQDFAFAYSTPQQQQEFLNTRALQTSHLAETGHIPSLNPTTQSIHVPWGKKSRTPLYVAAFALVAVAIGSLLWFVQAPAVKESSPNRLKLIVMPIENRGDKADDYIVDSFTEMLISSYSRISETSLVSAEESFSYKSQLIDNRTLVERHGVSHILSGVASKEGSSFLVQLQLTETPSGKTLWSNAYKDSLDSIFTLKHTAVIESMREYLGEEITDRNLTQFPATSLAFNAFESYSKARDMLRESRTESEFKSAIEQFQTTLESAPQFALAYAGSCKAYLKWYRVQRDSELFRKAESNCHRAMTLDNSLPDVSLSLANLYMASGQFDDAEREFRFLYENNINSIDAILGLATTTHEKRDPDSAKTWFEKAIDIDASNAKVYSEYAYAMYREGNFPEAADLYDKASILRPDIMDYIVNAGTIYYLLGDLDSSKTAYLRGLEIQENSDLYSNLGAVYYHLQDYTNARRNYQKAIELAENNHLPYGNLAEIYAHESDRETLLVDTLDKAIGLARKELEINSRDAFVMSRLAVYYAIRGDRGESQRYAQRAESHGGDDYYVFYDLALAHCHLKDQELAMRYLAKAIKGGYNKSLARRDRGFSLLHGREDFKALLAPAT